jgi:hypothetical protein
VDVLVSTPVPVVVIVIRELRQISAMSSVTVEQLRRIRQTYFFRGVKLQRHYFPFWGFY